MRDIERYARNYKENLFEQNVQVKYRRKKVTQIIEQYKSKKILEIGCGMEPIFKHVNMATIDKVIIVEPAKEFAEYAKKNADLMGLATKVVVISESFEEVYKELSESFDMILCSGLLHEVESPQCLVECIKAVCAENTIFHTNVPNAFSLHRLLAYEMGLIADVHELSQSNKVFQQFSVFDLKTLEKLIVNCGFSVLDKGSYFCKPFTHNQMEQMQKYGILNNRVLDGLDRLVKYMPEYGSEIYVNAVIKAAYNAGRNNEN